MKGLKDLFLLDPEVIFLNHGSFGACPRPVFEEYQEWQRRLERQPVEFLGRQVIDLMAEAREGLADFLGVASDEVVYFSNPTTAINMVARNLDLQPGDEILASDHEYGALNRTWNTICRKKGAHYVQQPIPLPVTSREGLIEGLLAGANPHTRAIFISHITSPTALIFPVEEICQRARQMGILSIVDGAHAPGQIPLNLSKVGADIYTGACHKWLMAPKGAAFLYARKEVQNWLDPLVISWGYESDQPGPSQFIDYHEWQGTRDISAFLTVPAAIRFQAEHQWEAVRQECHRLATETRRRIDKFTGLEPICPDSPEWFAQMFTVRMPDAIDLEALKARLYEEFKIELPAIFWNGGKFLRVSFQGYNRPSDAEALLEALAHLL